MKENINKFLLTGDEFMPEIMQKLKETRDPRYIPQIELHKA